MSSIKQATEQQPSFIHLSSATQQTRTWREMKIAVFLLALAAVAVYAAPGLNKQDEMEALIEDLLFNEEMTQAEEQTQLEDLLKNLVNREFVFEQNDVDADMQEYNYENAKAAGVVGDWLKKAHGFVTGLVDKYLGPGDNGGGATGGDATGGDDEGASDYDGAVEEQKVANTQCGRQNKLG